jgi:hypothetical protein
MTKNINTATETIVMNAPAVSAPSDLETQTRDYGRMRRALSISVARIFKERAISLELWG